MTHLTARLTALLGSDVLYRFRRDPVALTAFAILVAFVLAALLAPWLSSMNPHDPAQIDIMNSEIPPVWTSGGEAAFPLGTDVQGRDLLSAILYGLRISIVIGVFAVMVQMTLGIVIGLVSGYLGGKVDAFFMRLADIQLAMSTLMLAIIALAVFKAAVGAEFYEDMAIVMLVLVIGFAEWPQYARTIRASVLAEKKKEYVDAARVIGLSAPTIMARHILPNTLSPLLVISTVQVANAIISEAALSFLGLGMPVTMPSLGSLISSGFEYIFSGAWWITTFPSIALITLILAINLLGDWLRDVLNPRLFKG
ncbi:ABC transporter permease [Roseospira visakhapatnamensis]|uniref:Peptide/nickel transport system permease protein n=1 Tax=Roseospira visakhapatnamensis TaxID=390880 RepID=A0A7W6RFW7_9PROT|nr:ABC transporter permease [Roseospira visakhapatnamensis]MBB4267148.1 peptide/nickel transport system permease protein [Roseospira visakhapatnamensis]